MAIEKTGQSTVITTSPELTVCNECGCVYDESAGECPKCAAQ